MVLQVRIPKNAATALKSMKRLMKAKKKISKKKKTKSLPKGKMLTNEVNISKLTPLMRLEAEMKQSAPKAITISAVISPLLIV
jgi:hypothetical protein